MSSMSFLMLLLVQCTLCLTANFMCRRRHDDDKVIYTSGWICSSLVTHELLPAPSGDFSLLGWIQ